jgi:hypothetical protein
MSFSDVERDVWKGWFVEIRSWPASHPCVPRRSWGDKDGW